MDLFTKDATTKDKLFWLGYAIFLISGLCFLFFMKGGLQ